MSTPCEQVERLMNIEKGVERLDHAVFGNGDPGIRTNLLLMSQQQEMHGERVEKIERLLNKVAWGIVASVGMAVLNLIIRK